MAILPLFVQGTPALRVVLAYCTAESEAAVVIISDIIPIDLVRLRTKKNVKR